MFLLNTTEELTTERICEYIKLHRTALNERYEKLESYYKGEHDILNRRPKRRDDPCNNVVCNYAKYITDIGSGFLIGEPVSYQSEENDLSDLLEWFKSAEVDVQDNDNAEDQSIYGVAYELVYMSSDDSPTPKTASIHPSQAFVIYNNTVELNPVAGVYYHETRDTATQQINGYDAEISTDKQYIRFHLTADYALDGEVATEGNPFGMVTLIEIYNNRFLQGDFEQLISLIDGYNKQQSNRIDDKENFVNSLMVLKGQTLGYNQEEKAETYQDIKDNGVIELTEGSDLSFLTRQSDQQGDQLLTESIAKDIHKFSYIPDLTDEHFAANVSGVAMQFKLWGLLQLMKKKERYIKEGLRYRIKLFSAILAIKGKKPVDVENVTITITRNLPKNLVELAQVIGNLSGICSNETLVAQLPFVEDPEKEVEKAAEEKRQAQDEQFVMVSKSVNENDEE
ncbi:phage portal protein [Ruminococcus sp.]|uniref:phage portal protein n=1 Tax=Ruminococcus sp. TaxID=41978 RepID=UPI001B75EBF7|nr:phage portal protein [Ruminococcus sp.]MBP5432187.1 phage portal protein [Ruminococcus sp.]